MKAKRMDFKRNILNLTRVVVIFMYLCMTEAIHSEIEELIELSQQQQLYATTTEQPLLYVTEVLQSGGQNGTADPETETGKQQSQQIKSQQKSNDAKSNKPYGVSKSKPSKQMDKTGRKTNEKPRKLPEAQQTKSNKQADTKSLRVRCNGTPVGKCGGPTNKRCPAYSQCSFVNTATGAGICCRTRPCADGNIWLSGNCLRETSAIASVPAKTVTLEPDIPICTCNQSCMHGYMGTCGGFDGKQCPAGSTCKHLPGNTRGWCCSKSPHKGKCPNGEDGVCGTSLRFKCRSGTTCRFMQKGITEASGKCCIDDPMEAFCPSGTVGRACSSYEPCKTGFTCRYGFCCRDETCPKRWINGGSCNLTPSASKCPKGYKCIKGYCCRVPEIVCPSGVLGQTCSFNKPCKPGYMCRFGNCCRN